MYIGAIPLMIIGFDVVPTTWSFAVGVTVPIPTFCDIKEKEASIK